MDSTQESICLTKKEMKVILKALEAYTRILEKKQDKLDSEHETVRSHDEMACLDDQWDRYDRRIMNAEIIMKIILNKMK